MTDTAQIQIKPSIFWKNGFNNITASLSKTALNQREIEISEYEKQEKEMKCKLSFSHCGLGSKYLNARINNYNCNIQAQKTLRSEVENAIIQICADKQRTVCLLGSNGIGKTHLASGMLWSVCHTVKKIVYGIEVYRTVKYVLSDSIREEYEEARNFSNSNTPEKVIKKYADYDLLVIDEIGRITGNTNTERNLLYKILNAQYENHKSTVLISNMKDTEFAEYVGSATMDRLSSSALYLHCDGIPSYRQNEWI